KKRAIGVAWQGGETLVAGIGQGFILTTPLQLAVMTARLASGKAVKPHLIRAIVSGGVELPVEVPQAPRLKVSPEALRAVLDGMDAVTNSDRGTARGARIEEKGLEMAGKTGTSQVRRISKHE